MPEHHFLNLGAGVQSTALYLMSIDGDEPLVPKYDAAIFADVQEEPDDVYKHLDWLDTQGGPPIVRVTRGKLGDAIEAGTDSLGNACKDGSTWVSIPVFTRMPDGSKSITRRQCTNEYKVRPVEREIRRRLGAAPGRGLPKDIVVHQYMGLSHDEPKRVIRVKQRFLAKPSNWQVHFPLFEMEMTRADCVAYLKKRVPHQVPRSACVFCPFKTDVEWRELRENDAAGWARAVHIDKACRQGQGLDQQRYVHKQCVPLDQADLRPPEERSGQKRFSEGFQDECEGYCGN
jgi:hypothetical protein